jgi:hypothetical protein
MGWFSHQRLSVMYGAKDGWNCRAGTPHGTVARFLQEQGGVMFRMLGQRVVFLLLTMVAMQFLAMATADDWLRQGSAGPLEAHDQLPGTPDGQTESDQSEGELEELAFAQGQALRIIHLTRTCPVDNSSCPRTNFVSDWFRPPTLS